MRIVNRAEFLALPSGTLYCRIGSDLDSSQLRIKYQTVGSNDWVYSDLTDVAGKDSKERTKHWDKALNDSTYEMPMTTDLTYRDGLYETQEASFLVYSKEEVRRLIKSLTANLV